LFLHLAYFNEATWHQRLIFDGAVGCQDNPGEILGCADLQGDGNSSPVQLIRLIAQHLAPVFRDANKRFAGGLLISHCKSAKYSDG
jgi:hypothetical protein